MRKSVARESINTVNSMLEKKLREQLRSEQNSFAVSTQHGYATNDYYSRQITETENKAIMNKTVLS